MAEKKKHHEKMKMKEKSKKHDKHEAKEKKIINKLEKMHKGHSKKK